MFREHGAICVGSYLIDNHVKRTMFDSSFLSPLNTVRAVFPQGDLDEIAQNVVKHIRDSSLFPDSKVIMGPSKDHFNRKCRRIFLINTITSKNEFSIELVQDHTIQIVENFDCMMRLSSPMILIKTSTFENCISRIEHVVDVSNTEFGGGRPVMVRGYDLYSLSKLMGNPPPGAAATIDIIIESEVEKCDKYPGQFSFNLTPNHRFVVTVGSTLRRNVFDISVTFKSKTGCHHHARRSGYLEIQNDLTGIDPTWFQRGFARINPFIVNKSESPSSSSRPAGERRDPSGSLNSSSQGGERRDPSGSLNSSSQGGERRDPSGSLNSSSQGGEQPSHSSSSNSPPKSPSNTTPEYVPILPDWSTFPLELQGLFTILRECGVIYMGGNLVDNHVSKVMFHQVTSQYSYNGLRAMFPVQDINSIASEVMKRARLAPHLENFKIDLGSVTKIAGKRCQKVGLLYPGSNIHLTLVEGSDTQVLDYYSCLISSSEQVLIQKSVYEHWISQIKPVENITQAAFGADRYVYIGAPKPDDLSKMLSAPPPDKVHEFGFMFDSQELAWTKIPTEFSFHSSPNYRFVVRQKPSSNKAWKNMLRFQITFMSGVNGHRTENLSGYLEIQSDPVGIHPDWFKRGIVKINPQYYAKRNSSPTSPIETPQDIPIPSPTKQNESSSLIETSPDIVTIPSASLTDDVPNSSPAKQIETETSSPIQSDLSVKPTQPIPRSIVFNALLKRLEDKSVPIVAIESFFDLWYKRADSEEKLAMANLLARKISECPMDDIDEYIVMSEAFM